VGEIFNTCIALRKSIRRNEKEKQNFCGDSHSCN